MKVPRLVVGLSLLTLGAGVATAQNDEVQMPLAPLPSAEAGAGYAHYVEYGCAQCHSYDGQGGLAGPRIGPESLPYAVFEHYLRFPSGRMPAYSPDQLSSEQVKRIHDYLTALPTPPAVSDVPLLDERAEAIVER